MDSLYDFRDRQRTDGDYEMEQYDEAFLPLIETFDRDHLQQNTSSVFGFWPDLTLSYTNPAWSRFAADNDGEPNISHRWGIGARLTDAVSSPLDVYYAKRLTQCLAGAEPWHHEYECSSPHRYRKFHMIVYPLKDGRGGLAVNSLVVEKLHDLKARPPHAPVLEDYLDENHSLHQCMHCRRTRCEGTEDRWDWVPAWVAKSPSNTSHGLCQTCLDFYYPELEEDEAAVT